MNADALAAVRRCPGRATADRRRSSPSPSAPHVSPPAFPRSSRSRAQPRAGACASPLTPPLIHYLRTADRFQPRSRPAASRSFKFNALPMSGLKCDKITAVGL
ncbi:unnamed protein product [Pieris brassicae]|uniref:Uncharacterized protein n=1 Tax=Pieris brassicae TaxID=7116 RepID=A0A9P0TW24_PIEBR|nr:unnamed protein product [Pieris brassicae]